MQTTDPRSWIPSALLLSLALGCAGYRITAGGNGSGYDIYRPEPYVLLAPTTITRDEKNKKETIQYKGEIVWLPNYEARYRVKTWNHFGKADFEFEFEEGWKLTSLTDKSDNTEPMKTLISAAKDLAVKATTKFSVAPPVTPTFELYKIIYDREGKLLGIAPVPAGQDLTAHALPAPEKHFEWPGLLGGLSWILGFGDDSY